MLKKEIEYMDLEGNPVKELFYFNINQAELLELLVSEEGGFDEYLKRVAESENAKQALSEMKKIILLSIGKVSPDGKKFIKNQEIRDDFVQTEAYSELLMWLFEDADKGAKNMADFVNSIVSPSVRKAVEEAQAIKSNVKEVEGPKTAEELLALNRDLTPREMAGMSNEELAKAMRMKMERDAAK